MILDHRPDTLTPALKEISTFRESLPRLLEAARTRDARIALLTRQALRDIYHYHLPLAHRLEGAWVFAVGLKLETPNRFRAHWSLQNSARAKWEKALQACIAQALGAAAWSSVLALGRRPACAQKMALQIVRFVPSSREFIRDDDNLAFSRKGSTDAMKRLGLLKDDRREWLDARPIHQDVSPNGTPITVFYLWPAVADLF